MTVPGARGLAEAHVRVLSINARSRERRALVELLTPAERDRMARFTREADALRFLVGRATLRRELAACLGVPATQVPLGSGAHGKPMVAGGPHVNVSHSGDIVVVALCGEAEIGVDVEQIIPAHAAAAELSAFFSAAEIREHLARPAEQRVDSFFHIWTTKEALLKAAGTGLALSLSSFDVSADPTRAPALLAARGPELSRQVCLAAVDVPAGYRAVLATFAATCRIDVVAAPCDA